MKKSKKKLSDSKRMHLLSVIVHVRSSIEESSTDDPAQHAAQHAHTLGVSSSKETRKEVQEDTQLDIGTTEAIAYHLFW